MADVHAIPVTATLACLGKGLSLVALAAVMTTATNVSANESPALSQSQMIEFAELCESSANTDHAFFVTAARAIGFEQSTSVEQELDLFFAARERAFAYRGDTNKMMFNSTDAMLASTGDQLAAYFVREDDWVLILRSPAVLGTMNDIEFGDGHSCQFFGYAWIDELAAEEALATLVGEDFLGRGRTLPGTNWNYLFSGNERGDYPRSSFSVAAVKGVPDNVPPTINIDYVVIKDMTISTEVLQSQ